MSSNGISGLPDLDFMASGMYPGSQQDQTQYAAPAQLPAGAQAVAMQSEYEARTNPVTGEPMAHFNSGGIAALRYDDGGDVQQPQAPAYSNDDKGNLVDASGNIVATVEARNDPYIQSVASDPTEMQTLFDLKNKDPKQFYSQVADQLGSSILGKYKQNQNYDNEYTQLQSLKNVAPADYYRNQLGFKANSMGWQVGQNRGERNAPTQQEIQDMIPEAQKAGLSSDQINSIVNQNFSQARNQNVQRIAQDSAANKTGGFGGLVMPAAAIAAMVIAPELAPFLAPELGAIGGTLASGALTGGAMGGIGAGVSGGDIGKGILMGGATGAAGAGLGGALNGLDPSLAQGLQGLKTANSVYNFAQNPSNIGAGISAAKGAYQLGNTMTAAQGGIAHSTDGIASLGSYSDGGQLLKGPGDGMSDHIPATIGGKQPARLADGEFVIPADVVSHLGNGSTDAGAKHLYKMMDKIRRARTGNPKQGKQINANKFLPRN